MDVSVCIYLDLEWSDKKINSRLCLKKMFNILRKKILKLDMK